MSIPPLSAILSADSHSNSPLAKALSILFEPSPVLFSTLEPQLTSVVQDASRPQISSYAELIDAACAVISTWGNDQRSQLIAGHPRIGENKSLSTLSANEQGAINVVAPTPPEVLARLTHLNACYERKYPGLRYITFVNGRSRATIVEEMEDVLGFEHLLSRDDPSVQDIEPVEVGGSEWTSELDRAIDDIGKIAKSRLGKLGVE